jgi:hypothetical protein
MKDCKDAKDTELKAGIFLSLWSLQSFMSLLGARILSS